MFREKSQLSFAIACALALLTALPAAAVVEPERPSFLQGKELRHPGLYAATSPQRASEVLALAGGESLWASLEDLGVSAEKAFVDPRTGRFMTLLPAAPLLPAAASGARLPELRRQAWGAFAGYLRTHHAALGVDASELTRPGHVTVHDGGGLIQIRAPRTIDGVPVRRSSVHAVVRHGNLVLFGTRDWTDVRTPPRPAVSLEQAGAALRAYLDPIAFAESWRKPRVVYVPLARGEGLELRLAWVLRPVEPGELGYWEALVDAHSGELLAFEDTRHYASPREVVGGVYPVSNDGVGADGTEQAGFPMPYADLTVGSETFFADSGGNLPFCADGTVATTLNGLYFRMDDDCGALSEETAGAVLDLGTSGGIDCVSAGVSAGDTHASRSGFYELNRIAEQARAQLPANTWLRGQVTSNMNIDSTCNAFWNGSSVNFYRSGGGCTNTGELAGVFDHEWGHGMDANDASPGVSSPGEGIADLYASLRLNTSCIGRNFRPGTNCGGFGDPCTSCDGVRDIDWAKRVSGAPHTVAWIDAACGSGGGTPCGGSTHCEGAVYAEAVWDLWNRDLPGLFGMSLDTARELATQLTYQGAGAVGTWFTCDTVAPLFGGCNADGGYLNYLAADDDDGDLANGTPHMTAIFAAFDRHGIACDVPAVQDSGCAGAPAAAPAVVATPFDRGVRLTWDAVAGAAWYNVYRTDGVDGCDFGKERVATTSGLEVLDDGLRNGRQYSYVVIPGGGTPGDTCFGPASGCVDVTPAAAGNPVVDSASAALAIANGDGDAFLDNCERATLTFDVTNVGIALTNPVITSVESPSHPGMDGSITFVPGLGASLAGCATVQGSFTFTATGLAFGDTVEFRVGLSGDELAGVSRFGTLRVTGAEKDLQAVASKTFSFESDVEGWSVVQGTFDRAGGGAGGSSFSLQSSGFLNHQCDQVRSPPLVLQATSTLSLGNNYDIEPLSAGTWYDRANVGIADANGARTVVEPDGGRLYNADSNGPGNYSGCNDPETGWAGSEPTWGTSTWSATALDAASVAGQVVRLDVVYGTDPALAVSGFFFDEVTLTDVSLVVADLQPDVCSIFADGFESGDTTKWSFRVP